MALWKMILVVILGLICGLAFVAVFGMASGIIYFNTTILSVKYKDLQVTVLDDETGEPIPKATVSVSINTRYFRPPPIITADTDNKGIAKVQIAAGASDFTIELKAKGFKHTAIACDGTSTEFKLKKLPKIILIVPNDYAGPIKFDLPQHQSGVQKLDPHKEYQFHANAKGGVDCDILEPPANYDGLHEALNTGCLTAFYEDGREIPSADADGVKDSTTALRHVSPYYRPRNSPEGKAIPDHDVLSALDLNKPQEIYVIGTEQDQKALLDSLPGAERIVVSFDFDIHDYNWSKTNTGF